MAFGTVNKQYISSINFLDQREILNQLLDITREEISFVDVMEIMGRMVPTATVTYHHYVNSELYQVETIAAGSTPTDNSGGSGQGDVTVNLTNDAGAGTIRVGSLVMTPNQHMCLCVAYTAGTGSGDEVRLKAVNTSVTTTDLGLAAGDKLSVMSQASGEGSLSPDPIRYGQTKYFNQIQLFKSKYRITDIELGNKVEIEVEGRPYILYKVQHECLMKHKGDISHALMFGQISDTNFTETSPTLEDAEGNPIQTTKGVDEYIRERGVQRNGATVNLTEYQALTRELNKRRCPQEYFIFMGTEHVIAHDNMLNALTSPTAFSPNARIMIDGRELDLGVDTFRLYGRTYHKKYLPILDHQNTVNFTDSAGFQNRAYFVPTGDVKVHASEGKVPRLRCRYMEAPDTNLYYREIKDGALWNGDFGGERTVRDLTYYTQMGLEMLGTEHTAQMTI